MSVTGMSQGYYPVEPDAKGIRRLRASFTAEAVADGADAAIHRLHGRALEDVEGMIASELKRVPH